MEPEALIAVKDSLFIFSFITNGWLPLSFTWSTKLSSSFSLPVSDWSPYPPILHLFYSFLFRFSCQSLLFCTFLRNVHSCRSFYFVRFWLCNSPGDFLWVWTHIWCMDFLSFTMKNGSWLTSSPCFSHRTLYVGEFLICNCNSKDILLVSFWFCAESFLYRFVVQILYERILYEAFRLVPKLTFCCRAHWCVPKLAQSFFLLLFSCEERSQCSVARFHESWFTNFFAFSQRHYCCYHLRLKNHLWDFILLLFAMIRIESLLTFFLLPAHSSC